MKWAETAAKIKLANDKVGSKFCVLTQRASVFGLIYFDISKKVLAFIAEMTRPNDSLALHHRKLSNIL
jgi:hypothetical protein